MRALPRHRVERRDRVPRMRWQGVPRGRRRKAASGETRQSSLERPAAATATATMNEVPNPNVQLTAEPRFIAVIIDTAVVTSSEIVNFHFGALDGADLSKPAQAEVMYRFGSPEMTAADRRAVHERWILAKAFQELLRAVRHGLENAYVCVELL